MFYMKFRRQYIMSNIRFDYSKALPFVGQHEIDNMAEYVKEAHNMLHNKTGAGNDFLGWVNFAYGL